MRSTAENADIDIGALFASLKRNWIFILLGATLFALFVWVVAQFLTPYYQSDARILIETRETAFTRPNVSSDSDRPLLDPEAVKSQVELISSPEVLTKVAEQLNLADVAEFHPKSVSLTKRLLVILGLRPDPRDIPVMEQVLTRMRENLRVYNVTGSRVIVVQFSSRNPQIAANVANAIADQYIATQVMAKQQLTGDATGWLEPEIAELTQKVKEAETKVADFRAASDLFNIGENTSLATQQMSDISTELSRLRTQRAEAQAKAKSIRDALAKGAPINSVPDIMSSGLMMQLSERRALLMTEIANLSTTLLDGHPRIKGLRAQLADIDRQILQESNAVLRGLDNDAATARSREQELEGELNRLKAQAAQSGTQEVELNALEREAVAQRELLQTYLARYREASSRADRVNQPADARIFSRASVAGEAYFPKILPMVAMSFVAALLLLSVFVLLRELFSGRALRPAADKGHIYWGDETSLNEDNRADHLNSNPNPAPVEPSVKPANITETHEQDITKLTSTDLAAVGFVSSEPENTEEHQMNRRDIDVETIQRIYESYTVSEPELPEEGEALSDNIYAPNGVTAIASRLMMQERRRIILISPEGDAGSAGSVRLLRELADRNLRVLLIDMTGDSAVAKVMLDGATPYGITDLLLGQQQFTEVIHQDLYSDADVIPTGLSEPESAMQQAERLPVIFEALETAYDFVLVETGAATAQQVLNLDSDVTLYIMSVYDSEDPAVAQTALALQQAGQEDVTILMVPHI